MAFEKGAFLFTVLTALTVLGGCGKPSPLEDVNRRQAATIESLNREISRLNSELDVILESRRDLLKTKRDMEEKLGDEMASGNLSVSMAERGLVVTVLDRVLFDSGRAELKESSLATLDKLADVLARTRDHMIYVEGHTDNVPIRTSNWRSNWELSTARAMEVLHYFADQKDLNPVQLAATGFGEFQPVTTNDSPEGRMKNRRVEIVISPKKIGAGAGEEPID